MSRHSRFDIDEDCSNAARIEALVLMRGGRILEHVAGVALALLDNYPVAIRVDGPRSGTYATLSKTGVGRPKQLSDRLLQEWSEADMVIPSHHGDQQVVDLAEGEQRLREVMQTILEKVHPTVAALLAMQAQSPADAARGRASPPASQSRTECFEALATAFDTGGQFVSYPGTVEIVQELLKAFPAAARNLTGNERKAADIATADLVLASPGVGKTRSILTLIEALPRETVIWVVQPTLKKAHEFASDMAGSSRPVHVFRGRGAPVSDGATARMCRRHVTAAELAAKGFPVKSTLCGIAESGKSASCPHAAGCAYLIQMKALKDHVGGGVFVLTHASLTQPPPCAAPHLVIIDEDPSANFPQDITVGAEALGLASEWATHLSDDGDEPKRRRAREESDFDALEDDEEKPEAVMELFERLLDGLACPAPLQEIAANNMVSEFEAALKMLRRLERKLRDGLKLGLPDRALSEVLADSALPELQSVQAVLSAILEEVRLTVSGAIDRRGFNGVSIRRNKNGQVQSITAHRLARVAIKPSVPMIVLDGTADPVLMARALLRRMVVSRIDLQRQGEVVQCLGRGFSNASLAEIPGYPLPASAAAERDQLWAGLETVLRREVAAAPNGVLVVSTLAVETEARRRHCCDDLLGHPLAWTHFGATRGINAFTHRQTVVLIGRKQAPASALEAVARSYFACDPKPFEAEFGDYAVRRRTLWDKSGKTHSTVVQVHPDSRVSRILWQTREAEVIQAIDRVRAVRFARRIVILNSLDLRRLDDDRENPALGVPADRHFSWPEFRNGGNRAEAVLEASGGFLPVAPKALVRIAPEIFPSLEAAKKWLQRTDLMDALAHHAEHLLHFHVRPAGQRGASWPLIVDQRRQGCLFAARATFEALVGAEMAAWRFCESPVPLNDLCKPCQPVLTGKPVFRSAPPAKMV